MTIRMTENYGSFIKDQVVRVVEGGSDWYRSTKKGIYIPKSVSEPFTGSQDSSNQDEEYEW